MPIPQTRSTRNSCVLKCEDQSDLVYIPAKARNEVWRRTKVYVPVTKCCAQHLTDDKEHILDAEFSKFKDAVYKPTTTCKKNDFVKFLDSIYKVTEADEDHNIDKFNEMSDKDVQTLTGYSKTNFLSYTQEVQAVHPKADSFKIGIYLTRFHTGWTLREMQANFDYSHNQIGSIVNSIGNYIYTYLTATKFGINNITRETIIANTPDFVTSMYNLDGLTVCTFWDGCEVPIPKSRNCRISI